MDTERLLELLEENARAFDDELATMLGEDEESIASERKRLEKEGVIAGYSAIVDWRKIRAEKASAIIQVKVVPANKTGFDKVCQDISGDMRVRDVMITSGKYDLMVLVRAETMDGISEFVTEKLAPMKEVTGTYTHVLLKEFKRGGSLLCERKKKRIPVS